MKLNIFLSVYEWPLYIFNVDCNCYIRKAIIPCCRKRNVRMNKRYLSNLDFKMKIHRFLIPAFTFKKGNK